MENKELYFIIFRLFSHGEPVGFEYWSADDGYNYTYGNPEKIDGYKNWGWCASKIWHDGKEIIEIKYVDDDYLQKKKERIELGKSMIKNINDNLDIINKIREEQGYEILNKIEI